MRIVIDLQGAQAADRFRGIGRYSLAVALAIARQRCNHEIFIVLNGLFSETIEPIRAAFDQVLPQDNIRVWDAPGPVNFADPKNNDRRRAAELLREAFLASHQPDWIYVTSLFAGYNDNAVTSIGRFTDIPTAVASHDLIPLVHREQYLSDQRKQQWYYEKLDHLRRAALLLAVSEASREEAIAHVSISPQDVVAIPGAADARFKPVRLDAAARANLCHRHGISRSFVMYTGGDDHRKNMNGLIRAYARLPASIRQSHQLVIVCPMQPRLRQSLMAEAADHGLSPDETILTGCVSDADLVQLYNACKLFVFPSWHEGFGLPPLEAMSCGAAVIGSNTTSVPEVIGRDDALFDPRSDSSISSKILEALTDDDFRAELARYGLERAKAYSWEESGRRAISAFERSYASRRRIARPTRPAIRRPRLAYVSPLPPDQSGIADYSAELLPQLSRYYDIELITSPNRPMRLWHRSQTPSHGPDWLRANSDRVDRVLYHFGNSRFHDYMNDLIADVPGTVVLHDFYLSAMLARDKRGEQPRWTRALYQSHGYPAVREQLGTANLAEIILKYPANLCALQRAQGVIVHSNASRQLAKFWYGSEIGQDWVVVPHLRTFRRDSDRISARAALGLTENTFLTCSFGVLNETKLNHRVIGAWLRSSLAGDNHCRLVFVGETYGSKYAASIRAIIKDSGCADRIGIVGWAEPSTYRKYLTAADVAVQLRVRSRGESSGTVLDCMNHGVATIVNACGSMAELPSDAVWMLPEEFDEAALINALDTLRRDSDRRAALGAAAREVIRTQHDPRACADAYADAIERFYEHSRSSASGLITAIAAQQLVANDSECRRLAISIAGNHPALRPARRLFVDVSYLVWRDPRGGVQRVTRNMLLAMMEEPPDGFRVEPVFTTPESIGYRYARRFALGLIKCKSSWAADDPIDPQIGDVFLGLDLHQVATMAQAQVLDRYRSVGVRVYHVVHDLLPVLRPDFFLPGTYDIHARWLDTVARFDGLVAVSQTVAEELQAWLTQRAPERTRPLGIGWCHLGADINGAASTHGMPRNAREVLGKLRSAPSFLLVGTVEPRKGHAQTLAAFERLWSIGIDVRLVLVGNQGWMVEDLATRLRQHLELGRRLFWLKGISDEYLDKVYAASTCLIAASEGEGFGLPVIEAARHKLPILARDIPVFREVAGDHAAYFSAVDPDGLATAVRDWLEMYRGGHHPRSDALPWSTWQQSTHNLLNVILRNQWPVMWRPSQRGSDG